MNHIKKLIIIAVLVALCAVPSFGEEHITVKIDGNPITFATEPQRSGNTIMVPMKEFFEAMGARILWVESERLVVAYKDNMHMKLQLGNKIAYRNGKRFMLESEPVLSQGHTMVPIQIISETFNMKPTWNADTQTLNLEGSDDDAGLKLFSDGIYKTKPIDELGIAISIPYHWENLEGPFQYGYQDDFESYSITLMSQAIDKTITLTELVDENKANLLDAYDEDITFTGEEVLKIDNLIEVRKLFITTEKNDAKQKQVLYILKQNDQAYFMTCHYGNEVPEEDIIDVFDNIISTFKIRNLSVDSEEEHYMEFEAFYEKGVQLDQEYYSNMVVEKSEIPFSGTLKEGHGLEAFKVNVHSDNSSLDFTIPIAGNAFDGIIYTPFGLGKHNIFISGIPAKGSEPLDETPQASTSENQIPDQESTTEEVDTPSEEDLPELELDEAPHTFDADNLSEDTVPEVVETENANETQPLEIANENAQNVIDTNEGEAVSSTQDAGEPSNLDGTQTSETETNDPVDELLDVSDAGLLHENMSTTPLIQYSIINIDSRTMRYRIPTNTINSKDVQIDSTARLLTYQVSSQYMKARELFGWMVNNINIDHTGSKARTNYQVFDESMGTPEQANQLYVAYLRALDIPARVMRGYSRDNEAYYWTELYLNGSWVSSDLIEGILLKDDEATYVSDYMYFNINLENHRNRYDLIQVMPY